MVRWRSRVRFSLPAQDYHIHKATNCRPLVAVRAWYAFEVNPKIPRTPCLNCGKEPFGHTYTYCSNACQHEYQFNVFIQKWKNGEVHGIRSLGLVSTQIKKYLRIKYRNKCGLCGWSKVNPKTGLVPLVADHIDGNWRNNIESNLRLLCPNCDSLSPTYAALNKGNGRKYRAISNRAKEARQLISSGKKVSKTRVLPFEV